MCADVLARIRARWAVEQVKARKKGVEMGQELDKAQTAQKTREKDGGSTPATKAGFVHSRSVFISGLSGWPSEAALRQSLEKFGKLVELTFPRSRDRPRGFAYATFEDLDAAKTAIEQGSCEVEGFTVRVEQLELSPVETNNKECQCESLGWGPFLFRGVARCHVNEYRRPATGHNMDYDDDCESSDNSIWFS